MKKLLTLLFCVQMAFSAMAAAWTGGTAASFEGGTGTAGDPYQISTAEQLAYLASLANAAGQTSNGNTAGKYYKLTVDIDLGGTTYTWTPIGITATTAFAGVFDGDNHIISNIYINNSTSGNPQGLFGWAQGTSSTNLSAIIKNITMGSGSVATTYTTGTTYTAAIAGRCVYTQLSNCKNTINVTGYTNAGGIVGRIDGVSTIDGCSNVGTVKSTQNTSPNTGGIVGLFTGLTTNGGSDVSYIRSCYNRGAISSPNYVGGIAGSATGNINIDKCFNTGTINGSTNGASGGIVGYGYNTGTPDPVAVLNISNCYNTGTIRAKTTVDVKNCAGGILGFVGGTVGRAFGTILNCYNIGTITGNIKEPIAGQLTGTGGTTPTGTVTNTYFLASSGTNTIANDGTSVADAATLQTYASTLNNSQSPTVWQSDLTPNRNGGYPILSWVASFTKLTAPTIQTPTAITTTGFTANWTTVANAIGYYVNVYNNAPITYKNSLYVAGQATSSASITGLIGNTTYLVTVLSVAPSGATYIDSEESGYAVAGISGPTVLLSSYSQASATSATVDCTVTDGAGTGVTARGICYATSTANPTTANPKVIDPSIGNGSYSGTMGSLSANTTYYFRAYATNNHRTNYSNVSSFIILSAPSVTTGATNISTSGFTANWAAVASASSYDVKVYDNTSAQVGAAINVASGTLSLDMSGLNPNATYTYTVTAKGNGSSTFNSAESAAASVTTLKLTPTVTVTVGSYTFTGSAQGPNTATNTGTGSSYTFSYSGTGNTVYGTSSTQPTASGTYTVTATVAADGNYASASSVATAFSILSTGSISTDTNVSSLTLSALSNLSVAAGNTLTIDSVTNVNSVVLAPKAKLTLSSGTLTSTNGITLESDANGTATLIDSYETPTITATVQQHVTLGRNWYLSSPVSTASYTWLSRGTSVQGWDEAAKAWVPVTTGTLVRGKGYVQVATSTPEPTGTTGTVNVTGTTNSGDVAITVSRTESGTSRGFNLVGNPYPSYLKWNGTDGFITDATNDSISTSFWYRTKNSSDAYVFTTYNGSSHLVVGGSTVNSVLNEYIPPMQAFWIRVDANAAVSTHNVNLTFKNNMRVHGVGDNNKFKAPKADGRQLMRLQLENGTQSDEALIYFDADAANSFDNYDSPKMMNNSTTLPDLYSTSGSERLVINGLNEVANNMELPLGFTLKAAATGLKLKVSELSNFASGTKVYLLDKEQNAQIELLPATEYTFNTTASTTNNESRFSLLFRAPEATTGVKEIEKCNTHVFVNAANQITIIAPEKAKYSIYNAIGQKVIDGVTTSNRTTSNFKLANGVYVVRVSENGKEFTTRVIYK